MLLSIDDAAKTDHNFIIKPEAIKSNREIK